ncbi:uncharacterized protein LOC113239742 [Hyposmocoma kahamanoa]|uniref:uncharacterized protein LOC113239742 n=1 Tax=Hyposmocoma kahamanoa TaxID=1477025 RepID=UPI000E6D5C57|nr:uncharacterized protein LOC113239742 [Hyposmocoma kahamanoa]
MTAGITTSHDQLFCACCILGTLTSLNSFSFQHMRVVKAPVVDTAICDTYTKLLPGHYICMGGVQDVNRHFCRRDNGGAVIQNNTLIGVSSYLHSCAAYTRTHAFPKVSSFARWVESIIWDDDTRPTTVATTSVRAKTTKDLGNATEDNSIEDEASSPSYGDPRNFMLTLPFEPINVPLQPSQDNSVLPGLSLYESYLQSRARAKTSTTQDPVLAEQQRNNLEMAWMRKYGSALMMMPQQLLQGKNFDKFNEYT